MTAGLDPEAVLAQYAERDESAERRILLADTGVVSRGVAHQAIRCLGLEGIDAGSADEALGLARERAPGLAVVDSGLPGGGFELCRKLRAASVPSLLLVPPGEPDAIDRAFASGAADVLARPIHWLLLASRITAALRLRRGRHSLDESRKRLDAVARLAQRDPVTGLLNRPAFLEGLGRALQLAGRHRRQGALLVLDLDDFQRVNQTLGHVAGDAVLRGVARRLERCLRQSDFVMRTTLAGAEISRLGGDEFTLLVTDIASADDAARVARRVLDALREPFAIGAAELVVSASLGIATYPADGADASSLLRSADAALAQAKERGRNGYQFFAQALQAEASRRLAFEQRVRSAVERREFEVYYQPQVDLASGRITGVEALLRWLDEEHGVISPAEFVPVAERAGLAGELGDWVLAETCRQAAAWKQAGLPAVRLGLNVSPLHFTHGLLRSIKRQLFETGLDARALEVEITEGAFMRQQDEAVEVAGELRRMGVSIALDDFGTGYSSLSYLRRFPVDALKIDRSFVQELLLDPENAAITEAILAMARALRLRVVAEGVEDAGQLEFLRARGCHAVQGYLVCPPVTAIETAELLARTDPLL